MFDGIIEKLGILAHFALDMFQWAAAVLMVVLMIVLMIKAIRKAECSIRKYGVIVIVKVKERYNARK